MNYSYIDKRKKGNSQTAFIVNYGDDSENPKVVAAAKGHYAKKIIEMAKEKNIDIIDDSSILSNIIDMDLGDNVPPQLYSVIAEVLFMLQKIEKQL